MVGIRKITNGDIANYRQFYFATEEKAQAFVDTDWDGNYKTYYLIKHEGDSYYGCDIEPKDWKADEYESHIVTKIVKDKNGNEQYVRSWKD